MNIFFNNFDRKWKNQFYITTIAIPSLQRGDMVIVEFNNISRPVWAIERVFLFLNIRLQRDKKEMWIQTSKGYDKTKDRSTEIG